MPASPLAPERFAADPASPPPPLESLPAGLACGRLALVGNAPDGRDRAAGIDRAEAVVRFNNAAGFGGRTGGRVDLLALVNRGGQMREWLDDPGFLDRAPVRAARAFLLPFPALPPEAMGEGEGACWTREILVRLAPLGRPVYVLPASLHAAGRDRLDAAGRPPSTGFLVALALLRARSPDAPPADVYGFGFEGWPGHPWAAERAWFAHQAAAGRLHLHPPAP